VAKLDGSTSDDALLELLHEVADAVASALGDVTDWGPSGRRAGQYAADLTADGAALDVLGRAGVGVLSEESGLTAGTGDLVVVVDPLDGSTNASRGVPWFATSLCVVDSDGPRAALVANQSRPGAERYWAIRGGGAHRDGEPVHPASATELGSALIGLSGLPAEHLGWGQFRALGAAALDLCLVASGVLDAYVDCSRDAHGVWDIAGGLLVCAEAGAVVTDLHGRDLLVLDHAARRTPVAAATPELHGQLLAARQLLA
jgi:fructose-1,6-bisphosphatase/inositol monophosphatase family enzyme